MNEDTPIARRLYRVQTNQERDSECGGGKDRERQRGRDPAAIYSGRGGRRQRDSREGGRGGEGIPREAPLEQDDDLSFRTLESKPREAERCASRSSEDVRGGEGERNRGVQGSIRLEQGAPGKGQGAPPRGDVEKLF